MWASSWPSRAAGRSIRQRAVGAVLAGVLFTLAQVSAALPAAGAATTAGAGAVSTSPAASAQAPPGTVTRTNQYLTDPEGRVLIVHGLLLPAGATPSDADLAAWLRAGFSTAGVTIPVTTAGRFPDPRSGVDSAATDDPGIAAAGVAVRALTDRGFRVVLRVVPASSQAVAPTAALTAAIGRLAAAFRDTGGLVGYEITAQEATRAPGAANAVVAADPFHLLWRERPAPFDPAATAAVNDPAGYLTGPAGTGDDADVAFVAAADGNRIGWFYPARPTAADRGAADSAVTFPAVLARPYPIAVAGSDLQFGVDGAGTFTLRYDTTLPAGSQAPGGLLTAVSLPAAAYPTGYRVQLTGAKVVSIPGSALLCVATEPGTTAVSLTVTRDQSGQAPAAAPAAGAAACAGVAAPATAPATSAPASAGSADDEDASGSYGGPLLWALPLVGALGMALLLAIPFQRLRRVRAGSRTSGSSTDGKADPAGLDGLDGLDDRPGRGRDGRRDNYGEGAFDAREGREGGREDLENYWGTEPNGFTDGRGPARASGAAQGSTARNDLASNDTAEGDTARGDAFVHGRVTPGDDGLDRFDGPPRDDHGDHHGDDQAPKRPGFPGGRHRAARE